MLANVTLLAHPNPSAPLNVTCDTSDIAIWGELQQCVDNIWQPMLFFSEKSSPAETHHSAFDRELLAVYATVRHFRHNLEGRNFSVTYVMSSTTKRPSLRQTRHMAYIAEFTTAIRYVKG